MSWPETRMSEQGIGYRGIDTGILRALAAIPDLELESDHDRNLFMARMPRRTVDA